MPSVVSVVPAFAIFCLYIPCSRASLFSSRNLLQLTADRARILGLSLDVENVCRFRARSAPFMVNDHRAAVHVHSARKAKRSRELDGGRASLFTPADDLGVCVDPTEHQAQLPVRIPLGTFETEAGQLAQQV